MLASLIDDFLPLFPASLGGQADLFINDRQVTIVMHETLITIDLAEYTLPEFYVGPEAIRDRKIASYCRATPQGKQEKQK